MEIAILVFDQMTALDAIGPFDVLKFLPGAKVHLVSAFPGPITLNGSTTALLPQNARDAFPHPDVLVVPGGPGISKLMEDQNLLDWIAKVHEITQWTTAVCTGSLLLGKAGLLQGKRATSHWMALEKLRGLGAQPVQDRVVRDGKLITAAGVSAGIDMALSLAGLLCGDTVAQTIQLAIEYDPQPPYQAGSPQKAPAQIRDSLLAKVEACS
ncbi:MAG TPA: DJ-1/PfpI family protein [Fibrobacteraceae bacterium]|nr:DJ-1/PfpI family protein [Fibrobacteraceae bacterium]